MRFKSLAILGLSVYAVPFDALAEHYRRLVDHAVAGDIRLDVERVTHVTVTVTVAWRRQVEVPGRSSSSYRDGGRDSDAIKVKALVGRPRGVPGSPELATSRISSWSVLPGAQVFKDASRRSELTHSLEATHLLRGLLLPF